MLPIFFVYFFIFLNLFFDFLGFEQGFLQWPFLICLVILFFSKSRPRLPDPIIVFHFRIIILASITLLGQQLLAKGFVIFQGGFNIILCTYVFYTWLSTRSNHYIQFRFILNLMKFLMFSLFLEFIIMVLGVQSTLKMVFPGYKLYNPFDTQTLFGLSNLSGSNSLFLGSQIAGTISLIATLIFYSLYRNKKKKYLFWFLLSLFLFIINLNGTNFLLLIILIILSIRKSDVLEKMFLFLCGALIIFFSIRIGIFDRFFQEDPNSWVMKNSGMSNSQYYLYAFLSPVLFFFQNDFTVMLFGLGANQYSIMGKDLLFHSDFGFFVSVVLKNGLIWTSIFLLYLHKLFKLARVSGSFNIKFVLKLSILSLLFSTFHYAPIFVNIAATVFFSYFFAVYLVYPELNKQLFKYYKK
jgi:hypothetical protein